MAKTAEACVGSGSVDKASRLRLRSSNWSMK